MGESSTSEATRQSSMLQCELDPQPIKRHHHHPFPPLASRQATPDSLRHASATLRMIATPQTPKLLRSEVSLINPEPLLVNNVFAVLSLDECAIPFDHPDIVLHCNASLDKTKNTRYGIPAEDIP